MGDKSGIEWTDATWNPVTGCSKVSAGCKNCYAEGVADRFWATQYPKIPYETRTGVAGYFASGDCARDAASDLEAALSEIRVLNMVIAKFREASHG